MARYFLLFSILSTLPGFTLIYSMAAGASEIPELEEIIVTAKEPERSLNVTASETTVFTGDDISEMNVTTIQELLETVAAVNLIQRGTTGSQADISIRGSSIEGVLVLINGIRVQDPQTGHFTMDIPVDLSSVERVEIMSGGGSSLYGASASGGVINIVTDKTPSKMYGGFELGSFGSGKTAASISGRKDRTSISLTFHGGKSDGYRSCSELKYAGVNADGIYAGVNALVVNWNAGFLKKQFGAGNFYAPHPSFEKTVTFQGGINARYVINDKQLARFRIGGRGHGDEFTLIRNRPEFYRNTHYNRSFSFAAEYLADFHKYLSVVIATETERTGITSPGLGNHSDYNFAVYGELLSHNTGKLLIVPAQFSVSMRFDKNSRHESIFSPGFGIVVPFGDSNRIRFRAERSFRSPTYTELYYKSPANRGDPLLKSEHSQSVEAGVDITGKRGSVGLTGFSRKSTDVIDWIRNSAEKPWTSANHGGLMTTGIEMKYFISISQSWNVRLLSSLFTQKVLKRKGSESKYVLNPVDKTVVVVFSGSLFNGLNGVFFARYEEIHRGGVRVPITVKVSEEFKHTKMIFSVSNLFNARYEELPGLEAPGRWFHLGLEWSMAQSP